ncbi:uncharacterized protein [Leptinotarsa decemlineata]|uniref:uncharacterized protein n=1 Tax=Leptinotarsa decemlineata TaxID=7539 RepID=UPI003D30AB67
MFKMPRSKNNVTRPQPIAENVKNAVKKVIKKRSSIRKAAEEFKVSKSLIGHYVKLNKENETTTVIYKPNNAVKRVFSDEKKEQLVEYCLTASQFHYGIPKEQFLKLAYQYVEERREKSRVLTDTPEKRELEQLAAKKRKNALQKNMKTVKKRVFKKKIEYSSSDKVTNVILERDDDPCDDDQEENNCAGCGENYFVTSRKEDWITCCFWVHEDSTSFNNYCQKCGLKSKK